MITMTSKIQHKQNKHQHKQTFEKTKKKKKQNKHQHKQTFEKTKKTNKQINKKKNEFV